MKKPSKVRFVAIISTTSVQNAKQILRWWRARDGLSLFKNLSSSRSSSEGGDRNLFWGIETFFYFVGAKQAVDRSSGARAATPSTTTACNFGSLMPVKVKTQTPFVSRQLASCPYSKLRRDIFQEIHRKRHCFTRKSQELSHDWTWRLTRLLSTLFCRINRPRSTWTTFI